LNPDQYAGLAGFRFALRRYLATSEALCRQAGVTAQQYQAMLAIRTRQGSTLAMKELAEQLLLTPHAAVQLVDRLARAGLAKRTPSTEDRRSVSVELTEVGEQLLERLACQHLQELQRQGPELEASLSRLRRLGGVGAGPEQPKRPKAAI
jgi:DNA-binding MarR family transcriptional regulator